MAADSLLTITGLCAGYGRIPVLDRIGFSLARSGFVGVLGHNGAGKSTLLKTLIGLIRPSAGQVHFAGREITRLPPERRARLGIGYVPQGRGLFASLSVRDNLRFALAASGRPESALAQVLAPFPALEPLLDRDAASLSGGEQQMLALARAFATRPRLMLLDEPSEGLAPALLESLTRTLASLRRDHDLAILLVEQNLDMVRALAERVLILHKGAIQRAMSPAELDDPAVIGQLAGLSG